MVNIEIRDKLDDVAAYEVGLFIDRLRNLYGDSNITCEMCFPLCEMKEALEKHEYDEYFKIVSKPLGW